MADSKAVAKVDEKSKALALDDDMFKEAAEFGGAGRTEAMEDNIVPRLTLLQALSPEIKKSNAAYVSGAEAGMILNKATGKLYTEIYLQPWAADRNVLEWVPRERGGGLRGKYPLNGRPPEEVMKSVGGKEKPDPKDPTKTIWMTEMDNELQDTRDVFCNIYDPEAGTFDPAVISFKSTGHTAAKQWSTLRNQSRMPDGSKHPIWFKYYRLSVKETKNNKGEFYVITVEDLGDDGWVRNKQARDAAAALFKMFSEGGLRAAEDESSAEGDGPADQNI